MTAIPTLCAECGGRHDLLTYHGRWQTTRSRATNRVWMTRAQLATLYPPTRAEEEP